MKNILVFTGAGISAESGISTFRDSGGLWEKYEISAVATPDAWARDPDLVNEFYNKRRKQVLEAEPNPAHLALVSLERYYDVQIITQNIDDLHERAGSGKVLHLHGEIRKVRSSSDPNLIYELDGWELKRDKVCQKGSRLRPHVVWFGEPVPEMERAWTLVEKADLIMVIGTSLNVYPAAGLVQNLHPSVPVYVVDPQATPDQRKMTTVIRDRAGMAVPRLVERLCKEFA